MATFTGLDPYELSGAGGGSLEIEWGPHRDEPLRVSASLNQAADFLEHMQKVLQAARQAVALDIRDHFDQGAGPDGPWAPLAGSSFSDPQFEFIPGQGHVKVPGSGEEFVSGGPSHLTKTGAGRAVAGSTQSFVIQTDSEGGSIYFAADPPSFLLTHNVGSPGRYTQGGFFEGPNPLPKREWLWLSEAAGEVIFELFEAFVEDAAGIVVGRGGGVALASSIGFIPVNAGY